MHVNFIYICNECCNISEINRLAYITGFCFHNRLLLYYWNCLKSVGSDNCNSTSSYEYFVLQYVNKNKSDTCPKIILHDAKLQSYSAAEGEVSTQAP